MKGVLALLGFITTVFLMAGYLYKNNYRITQTDGSQALASVESKEAADDFFVQEQQQLQQLATPQVRTTRAQRPTAAAPAQPSDLRDWIDQHASVAVLEAVRQGVPAGVSLSLGIAQVQAGYLQPTDNFIDRVITPLAQLKERDKRMWSRYYKYSANSSKWFEGLYTEDYFAELGLAEIFDAYQLARFDAETYLALTKQKEAAQEAPVVHRASFGSFGREEAQQRQQYASNAQRVDLEVNTNDARRNMAYAMNRLSDERLAERGESMEFEARRPNTDGSARRVAENLPIGSPKRYYDPATFHKVLREVLALESGYASWAEYTQAEPDDARRQFARRSDPISTGGRMEITRKR